MPDDLDSIRRLDDAMPMMKIEALGFPRVEQLNLAAQLSVVVPRNHNRLAKTLDPFQQLTSFNGSISIVHEIAENDQTAGPVLIEQLQQSLRDRRHPPHRHETAGQALA
jgi:hypothetical protein